MIEWTGERFIPGEGGAAILYEHAHRYHLAQSLATGKRVVDLASGEGYGSELLSQAARSVIGVEIDTEALAHATTKYRRDNLTAIVDRNHYQQTGAAEDVLNMDPIDGKFTAFGWHTQVINGNDIKFPH